MANPLKMEGKIEFDVVELMPNMNTNDIFLVMILGFWSSCSHHENKGQGFQYNFRIKFDKRFVLEFLARFAESCLETMFRATSAPGRIF